MIKNNGTVYRVENTKKIQQIFNQLPNVSKCDKSKKRVEILLKEGIVMMYDYKDDTAIHLKSDDLDALTEQVIEFYNFKLISKS
jgi:hypothetical protein